MHCRRQALVAVFFVALSFGTATGQELPKATPEGRRALADLLRACVDEGGLKATADPKSKRPRYSVAGLKNLRAAMDARQELLTPALRDALVTAWGEAEED